MIGNTKRRASSWVCRKERHVLKSNFVMTAVGVPNYVIRCVHLLVCRPPRWLRRESARAPELDLTPHRPRTDRRRPLSFFLFAPGHREPPGTSVNCVPLSPLAPVPRSLLPWRLNCCATRAFHLQRALVCLMWRTVRSRPDCGCSVVERCEVKQREKEKMCSRGRWRQTLMRFSSLNNRSGCEWRVFLRARVNELCVCWLLRDHRIRTEMLTIFYELLPAPDE